MAGYRSIAAVGESLRSLLQRALDREQIPATVVLTGSEEIKRDSVAVANNEWKLELFLYRVDFNKVTRAGWSAVGGLEGRAYLPLDLHFLLNALASNARHEHELLGFAMETMERHPILSGPMLDHTGGWTADEAVQTVLEDIPTDDLMRIFESLKAPFRLTIPYLSRVIVVQTQDRDPVLPAIDVTLGLRQADVRADAFSRVGAGS